MTVEYKRMQQLRGSSLDWRTDNIVPLDGEFAVERTGGSVKLKLGDGTTPFASLPYLFPSPVLSPLGSINSVTTAPPPGAIPGDFWINTGTGTVIGTWGSPAAGTSVVPGDMLMLNEGEEWSVVPVGADLSGYVQVSELASDSGAILVGWKQSGAGAVLRTVSDKLREAIQTPADRGAINDGVFDCEPALAACDAIGQVVIPPGLFFIGSNITFTNRVIFEGGRFVIPLGVTVTFNGGITADPVQIFNVAGSSPVLGLREAWLEWFCGDFKGSSSSPPVSDARPYLNIMSTALTHEPGYPIDGVSIARAGPGIWLIDGSTPTQFNCPFQGASSGVTVFRWIGPATNGFIFAGQRGKIGGFQLTPNVPGTIPTSGTAILDLGHNYVYEDIIINDAWNGWDDDAALTTSNSFYNCRTDGCRNIGVRQCGQEKHWHDSHIVAIPDWCTITAIAGGSFNVGDSVSISGNTGLITDSFGGGNFKIFWHVGLPALPTAINDTTTGATGTLSSVTVPHNIAALQWDALAAGFLGNVTHDGDIIGGNWGLVVQGAGTFNSPTNNACWCRLEPNFCVDTTYNGSKIDKAYGMDVRGWFASTRNKDGVGLTVTQYGDLRINSVQFVNNAGRGLLINTDNAYFCDVANCMFNGNCWSATNTNALAEMVISAPSTGLAHDVNVFGGRYGYSDLYGRSPNLGFYVGKLDHTAGLQGSRLNFVGLNCAAGKSSINATQVNGTDQRIRVSCCVAIPDA